MVIVSMLFGLMRWLNVSALAAAIVLAILVVSVVAAVGLVLAISASLGGDVDDHEMENGSENDQIRKE
jgi:Na+(H+)/acetate symporter ActP